MNTMLWSRYWQETRWRFLIGVVLLTLSSITTVLYYPEVLQLLPVAAAVEVPGFLAQELAESVELSSTFKGYVWLEAFGSNLTQMGILFAALLGVAGPLFQREGRGVLFMLSLPASRNDLFVARVVTGLLELLVLLVVPALFITAVAPAIDERFPIGAAMIHALCLFVAASVFFSASILLSTLYDDVWRPLLIVCGVAVVLAMISTPLPFLDIFSIMSGASYFHTGSLPWVGLFVCTLLTAGLLYTAAKNFSQQDF